MISEVMMENHEVVSHEEWLAARRQLLAEEKEFTRLRDRISQRRRDLPWERVAKEDVFEAPGGRGTSSRSITSCSAPAGTKGARAAPTGPTIPMASTRTCGNAMSVFWRSRARHCQ